MNQLRTLANPFEFSNHPVRTAVDDNDQVWFCARDVCDVLDIGWNGSTLENMPEKHFIMRKLRTIKGERDTNFISEAGLYRLIFRSNKPEAQQFTDWVFEEVLPTIRKNGFFGQVSVPDQIRLSKQIDDLSASLVDTKNVYRRKLLLDQLTLMCNLANQPLPPLEWKAVDVDQLDLFLEAQS